jgi:hypothetical protein
MKTSNLLILTTPPSNPNIHDAIVMCGPGGKLDDEFVDGARHQWRPLVTFAYSIFHWYARNLALRQLTLGYQRVYWYRGGWEAWDSRDRSMAPLTVQLSPPAQGTPAR